LTAEADETYDYVRRRCRRIQVGSVFWVVKIVEVREKSRNFDAKPQKPRNDRSYQLLQNKLFPQEHVMKRKTLSIISISAICVVALQELFFFVKFADVSLDLAYFLSPAGVLYILERLVLISFFALAALIASGRLRLEESDSDASVSGNTGTSETAQEKKHISSPVRFLLWAVVLLLTVTALYVVFLITSEQIFDQWDWLLTMLMIDYYVVFSLAGASLRRPTVVRITTISVCAAGLLFSTYMIWINRNWFNDDIFEHLFFSFMIFAFWGGHSALLLRVTAQKIPARIVQLITIAMSGITSMTILLTVWHDYVGGDSLLRLLSAQSVLILLGSILTPLVARASSKRT